MLLKVQEGSSQTSVRSFVEQQGNKRVYVVVLHMLGELQRILEDLLIDLKRVFCIFSEGDESCHELVEDYTEGPEVNRE